MDFRASVNFLKLDLKLHVLCSFFFFLENVFVSLIGFFRGAQDSSKKVKNDSLVGKINYSHETATTGQEVSCC